MKQFYLSFFFSLLTAFTFRPATVVAQCPVAATCTPGRASNPQAAAFGMGIFRVRLGSIDTTTAGTADGYQNYGCTQRTSLAPGLNYPISITTNANTNENVRVWLDYNNDGAFDPVGELLFSSNNARLHTGVTAVIPTTAVLGVRLRLRVAADAQASPLPTPCSTPQYSQTEDYGVLLGVPTQPPVAAFSVDATQACGGTFGFTDLSQRGPATWRWTFGDGTTSTLRNPSHTYTQTGTYAVKLRACNAFGCDSVTQATAVTWYPALGVAAACAPVATAPCCGYGITQVSLAGQSHASADGRAGYEDFSCVRRFVVQQGQIYPIQVTTGNTSPHQVRVYIDYNNNGSFAEPEELVMESLSAISPSARVGIAGGGITGTPLRMRVVADIVGQPVTSCSAPSLGQVEDYSLTITPSPCAGLPVAMPRITAPQVCVGLPATLYYPAAAVAGASLQWQSSADSLTWTTVPLATTDLLTTSPITATPLYYRTRAVCGTSTRYSPAFRPVPVPALCYCRPPISSTSTCGNLSRLGRVWMPNTTLDVPPTGCDTQPDEVGRILSLSPASQTVTLQRGGVYLLRAVVPAGEYVLGWIDFNRNGVFEANEYLAFTNSGPGNTQVQATVTVPATATLGLTGLRLRLQVQSLGFPNLIPTFSCTPEGTGETLDLLVTIGPPDCAASPLVSGQVQGPRTFCPGTVPPVSVLAPTPNAALQWQTSPDSLAWTDVPGATAAQLSGPASRYQDSLYVRVRVQCTGRTAYSPAVYLRPDPQLCFCTPRTQQGSSSIALASIAIGNTPLYVRQSASVPLMVYQYYPPAVPANTATLLIGLSYPVYLKHVYGQSLYPVTVWVDYNADGRFTQNEATVLRQGFAYANNDTLSALTVPPTARPGVVRMRVMSGQGLLAASTQCGPNVSYLRDFLVTLARPPAPALPLSAGTVTGAASVCAGQPVRLATAGYSRGSGLQWEQLVGTAWQALASTEDVLYSVPITTATSFRVRVTAGANTAVSAPVTVAPTAPCPCTSNLGGFSTISDGIRAFGIDGGGASLVANTSGIRTASPAASIYGTYGMTDSTHAVVTAGAGCVCTVSTTSGSSTAVWADFNSNGVFEASEYLPLSNLGPAFRLSLPVTQPLGPLHLRVRCAGTQIPAGGACTRFTGGETQDYTVTVASLSAFAPPDITVTGTQGVGGSVQLGTRVALAPNATALWEGPLGFTSTQARPTLTNLTAAHSGYYLLTVRSPAGYQLTTARYLQVGTPAATAAGATKLAAGFTLFPNPASGAVTLRIANPLRPFQRVRVLNSTGQVVLSRVLTVHEQAEDVALDLTQQARGLYLVQLIGDTGTASRRLVLE
ncbi:hypothetical protein GCM10028824_43980 [Hymenobacter segetis]|uniref:GEVED domain-containing protein n=1 Tax=Hymenobacter segetis TaxID=2025509 RepID=A0ABU9LTV9_9BACT